MDDIELLRAADAAGYAGICCKITIKYSISAIIEDGADIFFRDSRWALSQIIILYIRIPCNRRQTAY